MHVVYNAATNRQTTDDADANGNIGSGNIYDIQNRLLKASSSTMLYGYDAANKRIWRGDGAAVNELTFWGVDGQKMTTYQISLSGTTMSLAVQKTYVYFGDKLVSRGTYNGSLPGDHIALASLKADRLDSIGKYYPYGQERPSATANDKEKLTGYFRDSATGLDYADQRYHQPGVGRFMSPDPYGGSAKITDPGSWNRYAYTQGDPVNNTDPNGLEGTPHCSVFGIFGCFSGPNAGPTGPTSSGTHCWIGGEFTFTDMPDICEPVPLPPPPPPELCGVNPVTKSPGLIQKESGVPGQVRPGRGGGGKFEAPRDNPLGWHTGIDIAGKVGSDVVSALAGTVTFTGYEEKAGYFVVVDIGHGLKMMYAHLEKITVNAGDALDMGQALGTLGQSGNAKYDPPSEAHLHFEIYRNVGRSNAKQRINPSEFLNNICPW